MSPDNLNLALSLVLALRWGEEKSASQAEEATRATEGDGSNSGGTTSAADAEQQQAAVDIDLSSRPSEGNTANDGAVDAAQRTGGGTTSSAAGPDTPAQQLPFHDLNEAAMRKQLRACARKYRVLLPTTAGTMAQASKVLVNDMPWLPPESVGHLGMPCTHADIPVPVAKVLGAQSLRANKVATEAATRTLTCPGVREVVNLITQYASVRHALVDALEVAEAAGARVVNVTWDMRSHRAQSVLQPRLSKLQGPALVIQFDGVTWRQPDVVRAMTPYVGSQGNAVIGRRKGDRIATGKVTNGPGLCSLFQLGDCVQVLTAHHLYFFDPASQYVVGACGSVCGSRYGC